MGQQYENVLFAGYEHSEETKQKTIEAICRTPLVYKPGTRTLYSDVDYMILGVIVEKVSGMPLDKYMRENFFKPLGLTRITYNPLDKTFDFMMQLLLDTDLDIGLTMFDRNLDLID